jgi:hypothetical protein
MRYEREKNLLPTIAGTIRLREAAMTRHALLYLGLLAGNAILVGCSSNAASRNRKTPEPAPQPATPSQRLERQAKPTARELAFSTYSNSEYGVTFRYPRQFALHENEHADEGNSETHSGARTQEEIASDEPGAVLVATVGLPSDAYPNTTFAGGSIQFAVNRYLTAGNCRQNLVSQIGDSNARSGAMTIQGVEFAWAENDEGDGDAEYFERDYAGFTNGVCYEFFLRVGVVATGEDATRAPDQRRILGSMEKVVSSLQFDSITTSVLDKSPSAQAASSRRQRPK